MTNKTISQLPANAPTTTSEIPFMQNGTTSKATALQIAQLANDASALTTGTLSDNRLSARVARRNAPNVFGNNSISEFTAVTNVQTGTTYTLTATDSGKVILMNNNSATSLILPNNLPVGFSCNVCQIGMGQVTVTPASGATIFNRSSHTRLAGQYASATLLIFTNPNGSTAQYLMLGDTAA